MGRGDVVALCNWVRHQLVVSSTDPEDLMRRRQRQRMETVPKSVSQTPRSGSGAQPKASLSDNIRKAWHIRSAGVTELELKTNPGFDGDHDRSIKYRNSEQVQRCRVGSCYRGGGP